MPCSPRLAAFVGAVLACAASAAPSPFAPVPQDHWSYDALQRVLDGELVAGYDGPFHGGATLTRYQLGQVLARVLRELPAPDQVDLATRTRVRRLLREYASALEVLAVPPGPWREGEAPAPEVAAALPAPPPPAPETPAAAPSMRPRSPVKVTGEIRVRPEYDNNNDFDDTRPDSRDYTFYRTTLNLDWKRSDRIRAFVALRDARVFGGERNAAGGIGGNTAANQGGMDLYQGYVDYYPEGDERWRLRLGRQEIDLGDERLVGSFNWSNTGRAFDGLRASTRAGDARLDLFHFTTADLTLGPGGVTGPDDQVLAGAHASWDLGEHTLQTYLLHFSDRAALNAVAKNGFVGGQSFETYGVRALGPLGRTGLDYKLEVAGQHGDFSVDELDAWAGAWTLGKDLDPRNRIEAEFDYSPGDEGTPGKRETWQNLFPTNFKFYGIANRMSWQNMRGYRLSWLHKTRKAHDLRLDLWKFELDDPRDNWYRANGAVNRPASPGAPRDLGYEVDLRYTFKDGNLKHQLGVARFMADDFARVTNAAGRADDSTFAYWMLIAPF